ncbi:MAG: hypothetical protein MJZ30_08315 [Paludibacteraceae bacterium]|nr:hypothetical protein [Paludibacteraceae bacterium]
MFQWDSNNNNLKNLWLETFKNLGKMENIDPSVYERADEGLLRLIDKAKVAALSEEEQKLYDASMKLLEDEIDMEEHGYKRGKTEERQLIISNLRQAGFSNEKIAEMTKIPLEEITKI